MMKSSNSSFQHSILSMLSILKMEISSIQAIFGTFIAFLLLHKAWINIVKHHHNNKNKGKKLPEPPGAWPLIGHLNLLRERTPVYRILGGIADNHGPIFSIRLGTKRTMVVSSWETIKECISTNDQAFLTRPASAASKYMGYGNALLGLTTNIQYWRHVRKIAITEVLSNRQLELLKNVRASEVHTSVKELYLLCSENRGSSCSSMVDMSRWFSSVILNILVGMISGKRYSSKDDDEDGESRRFIKAIHEFMYLVGMNVVSDVIPGTEWLDLQGHIKAMKANAKRLDYFMSTWLDEHLQKRKDGKMKEERDFIDALISYMADDEDADGSIFGFKTQNVIKATAVNLIIGGTDTTSLTLIWALSLLLNHHEVLKRAQEELDIHVGKERWVEEADIKNLVYFQAIVKEVLRLYPAGPLGVPREAMEDCNVSGYHIPKGTRLLLNIWKLHRDSRIWTDPDEFKPERFLTGHAHLDVRGQNFEYIPFGSGRRACPGISSGLQMVNLVLARLLQGFTMTTPRNEPVDMEEGLGITIAKAKPLNVMLSPRLSHALYQP
ncbi:hypothetical protein FEM48_Zijuj03G0053400 [Ziziphus jujuba var. spinosa]|uniref:Cytochrome P450 CYP82D47-like n=1 Tax=Ziziphus jujuba var. spinosa TaxID=714518 RepID=A0A978VNE8_ZIZJJ|nr:hypothetical protein FEM48_Zijuj03G0053400 [Ziziphus jujuba var. spinosa]